MKSQGWLKHSNFKKGGNNTTKKRPVWLVRYWSSGKHAIALHKFDLSTIIVLSDIFLIFHLFFSQNQFECFVHESLIQFSSSTCWPNPVAAVMSYKQHWPDTLFLKNILHFSPSNFLGKFHLSLITTLFQHALSDHFHCLRFRIASCLAPYLS